MPLGARTFQDVQTDALSNDFDPTQYGPRAQTAIDDALRDIARNVRLGTLDQTYTVPIVANTQAYALPTDFIRLWEVWNPVDGWPLDGLGMPDIDTAPPGSTGKPTGYAIFANQIYLWPAPNNPTYQVNVRYSRDPAILINPTDPVSAVIPDEYGDLLVAFARYRMFRFEDDADMTQFWRNEYDALLQRMKSDMQRQNPARTKQIQGRYGRRRVPRFVRP